VYMGLKILAAEGQFRVLIGIYELAVRR